MPSKFNIISFGVKELVGDIWFSIRQFCNYLGHCHLKVKLVYVHMSDSGIFIFTQPIKVFKVRNVFCFRY